MMFRAMGHGHAPHGRVIWGPFPAPWSALGTALAALFIGAIMFAVSLQHQEFRCAAGPTATCSVNEKAVFARASIHRVDVIIERGSKNSKYGVVTFTLERAQTYKLMRIDPDDANEAAAKIRMGLASGETIDVEVHESRVMMVIGIVGLVAFVVMLIVAFTRMGHYDLIVSPDAQTLLVKRSLFAFPLTTSSISIARVEAWSSNENRSCLRSRRVTRCPRTTLGSASCIAGSQRSNRSRRIFFRATHFIFARRRR